MKLQRVIYSFLILFLMFHSVASSAADFKINKDSAMTVWPDIPFAQGADIANFEYTIRQNRDEVRKMLWKEFSDTLMPIAMAGGDAASLAPILADILMKFDKLHEQHKKDAVKGLGVSLEALLRSSIDQNFEKYSISDAQRKMTFSRNSSLVSAVKFASINNQLLSQQTAMEAFIDIDCFMYGTYTILPQGQVALTITIENYRTGDSRSFSAKGRVMEAVEELGRLVFDFFQRNRFPDWMNPQPELTWIQPAPGKKEVLAGIANMICKSQGARIPYSRELILASAGTNYHPGGIPELGEHDIYVVADKNRWNEQNYLFTWRMEEFLGPVRTSAGFGTVQALYWCVKGNPSDSVRYVENLYRLLRNTKNTSVKKAIEYLLNQMGDMGANPDFSASFKSVDAAVSALKKNGILINPPEI